MTRTAENLENTINKLIEAICSRLSQDKRIRRKLPGGRIHIDRKLPFLCIYRRPPRRADEGTERLIMGEASYLIAAGDESFHEELRQLVTNVVQTLHKDFGAFLIFEIWSSQRHIQSKKNIDILRPSFRVITDQPQYGSLSSTIENLHNKLQSIRIHRIAAKAQIEYEEEICPPHLSSLLEATDIQECKCHVIGLEIEPIFRDQKTNKIYPLILQNLHHGIARALKQTCFEFVQTQTTHRPENYQALGRRAVVKAVWEIDEKLAEVSNAFDFLMLVTPVNAEDAWNEFQNQKFTKAPKFYYRPLPEDPVLLQRKLYSIPLERIEDPTLAQLFGEKQTELSIRLMMLMNRRSRKFLYGSLQLHGDVDPHLYQQARELLDNLPYDDHKDSSIDAEEFRKRASEEILFYRKAYPQLTATVDIRDDIPGVMAVRGNLLVGNKVRISSARVNALIQHEVGTHLLSYYNGLAQPFKQLYSGLAGYEELQEGLALISEYFAGELIPSRLRVIAVRVIAAKCLTEKKSFVDTFRLLVEKYQILERTAFHITMRLYRSGGCVKDIVYLRGLIKLMNYLKEGGNLESLFVGKIAFQHIPLIEELQSRKVLLSAPLRPRYMALPGISERLQHIKNGISINELIERPSSA